MDDGRLDALGQTIVGALPGAATGHAIAFGQLTVAVQAGKAAPADLSRTTSLTRGASHARHGQVPLQPPVNAGPESHEPQNFAWHAGRGQIAPIRVPQPAPDMPSQQK